MSNNVYPLEVARFGQKLKLARESGEAWPMLIYPEVLALWERWETIRDQIDGKPTFARFLQEQGTGRSWKPGQFKKVADVVNRLGESCRRTWTWPAAQWVYNCVPNDEINLVLELYNKWLAENNGHPLSKGMVTRRIKEMRYNMVRKASVSKE